MDLKEANELAARILAEQYLEEIEKDFIESQGDADWFYGRVEAILEKKG